MRNLGLASAALVGGLLMTTFAWSSAEATSLPNLKSAVGDTGAVTLVGRGRGGGMGGRSFSGGSRALSSRSFSGGSRALSSRAYRGGSNLYSGRIARTGVAGNQTVRRGLDGGTRYGNNWKGNNWKGKNLSKHNRSDKFSHLNRHRVFRNGAWVWAYGAGTYAYNDCASLHRQASLTGSAYWWNRYNSCRYSYY